MEEILQRVEEAQENNEELLTAREGLRRIGWDPKTPQEFAMEYMDIDFEFARPAELVSFNSLYESDPHGDFFLVDKRGIFVHSVGSIYF